MKVGYQGVKGAFSESAVRIFFEGQDYEDIGYSTECQLYKRHRRSEQGGESVRIPYISKRKSE